MEIEADYWLLITLIYTVTLNPAIDRELSVPTIEFDSVLRATSSRADCGGKGFNVSRMIAQLGGKSIALGFVGGRSGEFLRDRLTELEIETDFVWVDGETRTNVSIVTEDGHHIKVNEKGAHVSVEQQQALINKVSQLATAGDWWVLAGSLPEGVSADIYAQLITILNSADANVILDTSGEPLRLGCAAAPALIKPNNHEAQQLTGHADPLDAAHAIQKMGIENVIISLGSKGALLIEPNNRAHIQPPTIIERNPIGAGDALVGGLVWGLHNAFTLHESLRWGIACGSVAASLDGTAFGQRTEIESMLTKVAA